MIININFFGGPGTGKSTTSHGTMYFMKTAGFRVEYIDEYAKSLTYGKDYIRLSDQLHILGEQHHKLFKLNGQVDFAIHDSPFIGGLAYLKEDEHLPKDIYDDLITTMFKSYNNINIFLKRNVEAHGYQEYGRTQTLQEAIDKDNEMRQILNERKIPFVEIDVGAEDLIPQVMALADKAFRLNNS